MSRPLVRAVFAVLVVATIAAFLAKQLLKSEFPLVIRLATKPAHFSPNADGYRDETRVGFDLSDDEGSIKGDDRARGQHHELVVQLQDLHPVRRGGVLRVAVDRVDRCL